MKYMLLLLILWSGIGMIANESSNNHSIEEAFVTFATKNYFPLLEVTIESVHCFSKCPIIAHGINADIPFDTIKYPNLIKRRIDMPQADKLPLVYFQKFNSILQSNVRYGIYIEADDIVNYAVDDLFKYCRNIEHYPLCPKHPMDPENQSSVMRWLNVNKKTNPYVHGHIFFSYKCMPFIQKCYDFCVKHGTEIGANWDETVLNVMLWKHGVKDWYLPIIDPYYSFLDNYIHERVVIYPGMHNVQFYLIHGCKDVGVAKNILALLQENIDKPICLK